MHARPIASSTWNAKMSMLAGGECMPHRAHSQPIIGFRWSG
ncbi:hypothetical protein A176_007047 [Myxococcus hansupus]|uniref:Uncharacterized protein n=1 Tax=Pseudomyxococcus hansupus TaxID=1297742 RepID=A0A0H4X987_9BACT|nr:hypothetical protein A176_007047 [Myxococcus hansupus]